jgi:hypothetical protein
VYSNFVDDFCLRKPVFAVLAQISCAALLAGGVLAATPAAAQDEPTARLVSCAEHTCLRIEGRRDNPGMAVAINGEPMEVDGAESWRLTLPLTTVRQIAGHGARRLEVTLLHPATRRETSDYARLPIGLLGDTTELEAIRVTAS